MSKRSRRQRTPNLPPEAFEVPIASSNPAAARSSNTEGDIPAGLASGRRHATISIADLRAEYGIVIRDLRYTFAIFITLIVIMVALSFVLG